MRPANMPAIRSSKMTPNPVFILSANEIGHGFRMSKNLKNMKSRIKEIQLVCGKQR